MLALKSSTRLLFAKMDDDEIRELSQKMENLGVVTATMAEQVFIDFASQIGTAGLRGSYESAERKLLDGGLEGERVGQIMEELRGPAGRTLWDKLGNVNDASLAAYLRQEYLQTVAMVLSKLTPDNAAKVLAAFPEEYAIEVVMRMLSMEAVRKDVVDTVEIGSLEIGL